MDSAKDQEEHERTLRDPTPLNPALAAERLRDVKQVFDHHGIVFWLGSGTCLGCIRENGFIPWDDEIDTASVIGMHGLNEETVYRIADVFQDKGFQVRVRSNERYMYVGLIKEGLRTDWTCHRIIGGAAIEFPGVKLPLYLFTHPRTVEFIGEEFRVPNPVEEYLILKYGPEWQVPKGPGFESDVVMKIGANDNLGRWAKIKRTLTVGLFPRPNCRLKVFDRTGRLVGGAEVTVVGTSHSKTNGEGIARFYIPDEASYSMVIRYEGHEEVLYDEWIVPGNNRYIYRPGPIVTPEQHYKAGVRALALTQE